MIAKTSNSGSNRITAKPVRVTHTKGPDWIRSLPVPDNAWRIYETVRSYIYEQDPDSVSVRITDAELAELTHRSVSAAKRARQAATRWGLLVEARRWTESHGRGTARTVRELSVLLDEVPDWYVGPTNCWDIKRTLKANGGPGIEWSQVTPRTDQEKHETPGQFGGSDLLRVRANLLGTEADLLRVRAKVLDRTGGEQHEVDPQETSQEDLQEHQQQQADDVGGEALADNTEDNATRTDEGAPDGVEGDVEAQARRLIASLRPTPNPADRVQPHGGVVQPVARALRAGVPEQVIREYLVEGVESARRPAAIVVTKARNVDDLIARREDAAYRTGEQEKQESPQSGSPARPDKCDNCGPTRHVEPRDGAAYRCPTCHPRAVAESTSVADDAAAAAQTVGMFT